MQKKDMELEGTLRAFSLPDILQFLSMGKMTGILSIWREGYSIDLTIQEGKIINSSSLDRSRKLGQMLIYRGFVKRSDLQDVLIAQKGVDRGKMLGQILIERDLITKNTLREALKLQLEEEIWELFSWKDGQFKFEHRTDIDTSDVMVEIEIEPLLIEGSRRLDEWSKISSNIDSDHIILTVVKGIDPFKDELSLSESEWQVLSYVNGFYDVGSIVNRSGLGKFETFRILNNYMNAGLIITKPEQQVNAEFFGENVEEEGETLKGLLFSARSESVASPSRKGFSLFSRPKQQKETRTIQMDFHSPLGSVAFFVNSFFESLLGTEDFVISPEEDSRILGLMWLDVLMRYPKADMIRLMSGRVNVKPFESIIQWEKGITRVINECFEESLESLGKLCCQIYEIAVERMGERATAKMASGILSDYTASIRYKHDPDFELRSWIQDLLML